MKVAFIGLGRMGSAMARRLLDAEHEVAVYNRTPGKTQAARHGRAHAPEPDECDLHDIFPLRMSFSDNRSPLCRGIRAFRPG